MKKMGWLVLILLAVTAALLLCGCLKKTGAAPVAFSSFELRKTGSSAVAEVISATVEGERASLKWETEKMGEDNRCTLVREITGGQELTGSLETLLAEARVTSWDGFSGSNSNVLDGSAFAFSCTLADGKTISAKGSNKFPKNYQLLNQGLSELLESASVSGTTYTGNRYEMTLPEKWVGTVQVRFFEDADGFYMETGENSLIWLLRMEYLSYEPTSEEEYICIGTLTKEGEEDVYLAAHLYDGTMSAEQGTPEQYSVYEALQEDISAILGGVAGANGYTLLPAEK